jgi:hypothetical protein
MKPFLLTDRQRASWTDLAVIAFLSLLFAFSSFDKVFHYHQFVNAVRNYSLVPRGFANYLALPLIVIELFIAVCLLYKPWRRSAALAGLAAMILFTAALLTNFIYGARGICGCWFTLTLAQGNSVHIAQNIIFGCLFASVMFVPVSKSPPASPNS